MPTRPIETHTLFDMTSFLYPLIFISLSFYLFSFECGVSLSGCWFRFLVSFSSLLLLVSFYDVYLRLNEECVLNPFKERTHSERASDISLWSLNIIKALVLLFLCVYDACALGPGEYDVVSMF